MLHINRDVPAYRLKSGHIKSRPAAIAIRRMITGIASGMALQSALPMVEAQEYELVPPVEGKSGTHSGSPLSPNSGPNSGFVAPPTGQGVAVRARIDVLYYPPGGKEPVLVQRAFETSAATTQSSQYIFDVLNNAALDGVTQALAGGAQSGRVSVTAICYAYGVDDSGSQSVLPMGLFINTTDMKVMPDGGTALHTDIKVMPPNGR
ncbi:MAG: hypothetical protein ABMA14_00385 [Hyphomonadaceae bacterium]